MNIIAKLACQTVHLEFSLTCNCKSAHLILMRQCTLLLSVLNPTSLCTSVVEGRIRVGDDASLDRFDLAVG